MLHFYGLQISVPLARATVDSFGSMVYKMPSYRIPAFDIRLILLPRYGIPPLMAYIHPSYKVKKDDSGFLFDPVLFSLVICSKWRKYTVRWRYFVLHPIVLLYAHAQFSLQNSVQGNGGSKPARLIFTFRDR